MSNHTPGPWRIREKLGTPSVIYGGVVREYTNGTSQDQLIMVCSPADDNGGPEAMRANADLVAASPDLLEAAESIVSDEAVSYMEHGPVGYIIACEQFEALKAAVAKAKGGIP